MSDAYWWFDAWLEWHGKRWGPMPSITADYSPEMGNHA
jgi:hypothetical protein